MSETTEKSCWSITLWAVAGSVGLILLVTAIGGGGEAVSAAATTL